MTSKTFDERDSFKSSLKLSLIAHALIVVIATVKAYIFPEEKFDYSAAVRVDIVALPDKLDPSKVTLAKEEQKPKALPEKKIEPQQAAPLPEKKAQIEPEAINLKKVKSKQNEALEKLKQASALEKIKEQMNKNASAEESKQKVTQVKGNIISAGTALSGLNKLQHDNYVSNLDEHIKQNWSLPEWLAKRELKAQVRLKLDDKGQIISREIIKSSGNTTYDDMALDTIDKSAPFPRPPEKFTDIVSVRGIVIGFPE